MRTGRNLWVKLLNSRKTVRRIASAVKGFPQVEQLAYHHALVARVVSPENPSTRDIKIERSEESPPMDGRRVSRHLLQMGMTSTSVPGGIVDLSPGSKSSVAPVSSPSATSKSTRQKPSSSSSAQAITPTPENITSSPEPKKRLSRKKKESTAAVMETTQDTQETTQDTSSSVTEAAGEQTGPKKKLSRKKKEPAVVSMEMPQDTQSSVAQVVSLTTEPATVEPLPKKNFRRSVGQRKPQQDQVGE
ncbi:AAA ATPase [Microseira wollei NIES-4236]|uniref:AAA ATPase n=2 Tax=Microseira wollei TaxID=467598 RepID=A0AAV3XNZ9_9CYAN|nr:AAA ATPase [Microseira wollei NIES-4236]